MAVRGTIFEYKNRGGLSTPVPLYVLFFQNCLGGQNAVDGSGHDAARGAYTLSSGREA